jgi:hypothetical protein
MPKSALASNSPSKPDNPPSPVPAVLPACEPPDARTPPQSRVPFRQAFRAKTVFEVAPPNGGSNPPIEVELSCVRAPRLEASVALDLRFEQLWTLKKLAIGDLASTMSLAPGERLTLEFRTSQRQVLDRTVLDSSESVESFEATIQDKETVNVARSTSKTTNWHADATGQIAGSVGRSLGFSGGYSKNVSQTSQYSLNRITETTQKSAQTLKTLHKIEVKVRPSRLSRIGCSGSFRIPIGIALSRSMSFSS